MLDGSYSVYVGVRNASGADELGLTAPLVFYVSSSSIRARGVVDLEGRVTVDGQEIAEPGRQRLLGRPTELG